MTETKARSAATARRLRRLEARRPVWLAAAIARDVAYKTKPGSKVSTGSLAALLPRQGSHR